MVDAVIDDGPVIGFHLDMVKTGDIDPVFIRITAPEMVGIYPAIGAEIMPRNAGIPRITAQAFMAGHDLELILWHRCHHRPASTAERAIASPPLGKIRVSRHGEHHLPAMA